MFKWHDQIYRTIGLSKNGNPWRDRSALVEQLRSRKTTNACPRAFIVFIATTSRMWPNWEKIAYRDLRSSVTDMLQTCYRHVTYVTDILQMSQMSYRHVWQFADKSQIYVRLRCQRHVTRYVRDLPDKSHIFTDMSLIDYSYVTDMSQICQTCHRHVTYIRQMSQMFFLDCFYEQIKI